MCTLIQVFAICDVRARSIARLFVTEHVGSCLEKDPEILVNLASLDNNICDCVSI